ncbi:hypothetical protein [Dyella sp. AtDHG13]|uniref:hypothetical protein n=1 Tax=Dyella sp. AtDHG13 TaxID=1938897 RepID=UPI00094479B9|nr:hypothetical protein [Dyella sp. AtDHG13]
MDWIKHELLTGFQKLLTLGLERQPAAEVIPGTVATWLETITHGRQFDKQRDAWRFRAAFITLAGRQRTWPVPRDLIDALPPARLPEVVDVSRRLTSDEAEKVAKGELEKIGKLFHVDFTATKPKKTPPLASVDFPRCCEKGTREQPVCDDCRQEMRDLHGPVIPFDKSKGDAA